MRRRQPSTGSRRTCETARRSRAPACPRNRKCNPLPGGTVSKQGMIGMDVAAQEMLGVGETLTDEQWQLPSGAEGWSVKDVVAHAGCLMAYLMAAVGGAAVPDIGIEELNEV